ncbi:E3 ubiquitin-protein ligase UBR4-like isoform X2 [Dreissena polymorpha]|uniref:E3 ubiquitin-protein ligase UBR4-like isoform X2 n=1 Tax=Dreissena polymorpha TaxID=45954 RepID=UPI002264B3B9|nr:E3 ubiquitin-protein ligase UBR4-like isoform X2 [Dreissena polymorpha]
MATSPGISWAVNIKPILAASYSSFNKANIQEFSNAIVASKQDILIHDDVYDPFYSSFIGLAAHYLSTCAGDVAAPHLASISGACKVLLEYLLSRIQHHTEGCAISQETLMVLIKGLCTGQSYLPQSEEVTIKSRLKSAQCPPCVQQAEINAEEMAKQEVKRSRLECEVNIFNQMTSVFDEILTLSPSPMVVKGDPMTTDSVTVDGDVTIVHIAESSEEMKNLFKTRNLASLNQLNGGNILLDMCTQLLTMEKYTQRYRDALGGSNMVMPTTLSEALTTRNSLKIHLDEISIIWMVVSLPILEPLTVKRLEKIITVTMGCLYLAVTTATTSTIINLASATPTKVTPTTKEEEVDGYAVSIVNKALEIYNNVSMAIHNSTRAGGNIAQNLNLLGSWLLLEGLRGIQNLTPGMVLERKETKGRPVGGAPTEAPPGKGGASLARPGSGKGSSQGLGCLSVALGKHAVTLLQRLFDDLQTEGAMPSLSGSSQSPGLQASPGKGLDLTLLAPFPAWKRIQKLLAAVHIPDLLFSLVPTALRKAVQLKRQKPGSESSETSSSSTSDSNTFYEDDFSCSDDSSVEEDDDCEPILGHWMEGIMSPSEPKPSTPPPSLPPRFDPGDPMGGGKRSRKVSTGDGSHLVPDRRESDAYLSLASSVLQFLSRYFVNTSDEMLQRYLRDSLTEDHMVTLATVVKEMDRESARFTADKGDQNYDELSVSLSRFNHNLIATGCISDTLQQNLLHNLGVDPCEGDTWPLSVYPRTLAILAEVLLLRQQREREVKAMVSQMEPVIMQIWTRFMTTLTNACLTTSGKPDPNDDVNVEHMQLLLFLFHSLHLMQKKQLLLLLAQNVVRCGAMDEQPMLGRVPQSLCRLMLILEYMLHNFYDPPPELQEQVQWNLFTVYTLNQSSEGDSMEGRHSMWFPMTEVEESFRKQLTSQELTDVGVMKPRFYNIGPTHINNQQTPRVDGLACSFLLSTPEQLDYGQLYNACVSLLLAGTGADKGDNKLTLLESCLIHYNYSIVWQLLACLPPSVEYLKLLEARTTHMSHAYLLHTLRWGARLGEKAFAGWIKDSLVKQGLTTQQAESLLTGANKGANNIEYDIQLCMNYLLEQSDLHLLPHDVVLPPESLPGFGPVLLLDTVAGKLAVSLDQAFTCTPVDLDPHTLMDEAHKLLAPVLVLLRYYTIYVRSSILGQLSSLQEDTLSTRQLEAVSRVMCVSSSRASKVATQLGLVSALPGPVKSAIDMWNSSLNTDFPSMGSWRNAFASDILPGESYLEAIQKVHVCKLTDAKFSLTGSIKHVLHALCRLASDLSSWCPDKTPNVEMSRLMFPLLFDTATEYLADMVSMYLESHVGPVDSEPYLEEMYQHVVTMIRQLCTDYTDQESHLDENIFCDCMKFLENHIDKPTAMKAFNSFFEAENLRALLVSSSLNHLSPNFAARVMKLFNRLLQLSENGKNAKNFQGLCSKLHHLATVDSAVWQAWLVKFVVQPKGTDEEQFSENRQLLQTFAHHLIRPGCPAGEDLPRTILTALLPLGEGLLTSLGTEASGFPEVMDVLHTLALVGKGAGHVTLFNAATVWLQLCKSHVTQKDILEKMLSSSKSGKNLLSTLCCLLSYVGGVLAAVRKADDHAGGADEVPEEREVISVAQEADSDWDEELSHEEENTTGEDSQDEEFMNNKLCTFTITQKEFMNQHWYHCHTCKMVDGVGVCTVCAKVCHKDHDLTYAKFGSFFCDCGAREDGACKALTKRTTQSGMNSNELTTQSPFTMETALPSSLRRRLSSSVQADKNKMADVKDHVGKVRQLKRQLEGNQDAIMQTLTGSQTVQTVLDMLDWFLPSLTENYQSMSPMGSLQRAQSALRELHSQQKTIETTDQLMAVTLGSQEGAFENVRMSYSGDQGQQIRQLVTGHMLRRVAMCVLASPHGKRQHLAVSHEKGKITILQLSALLKQADSSKKKLTLTRLASAPIPFTVLSITGNPCNEDYLAVCGLKDCHVLTFTSSGSVADHLVLHPTLASGNYIIKALWLPGTQAELAIVTADFIKIYNLAADALSPQFYFLLPSGKVRDATFVFTEEGRYIALMSSSGYIYYEVMGETSNAKHGPFYITNVVEINHPDIKEVNGTVTGGGVSIYFSHSLQLIFFSYTQGKSFCAPLEKDLSSTRAIFPISFRSSNGGSKGSNSAQQPLVQWSEVPGHIGLLYCMTQTTNNPVVLMVRPDTLLIQEIKVTPAKAKIQDVVAIRHNASNSDQQRTTMILLCEDGSLRIYMASVEHTNHWLSPLLQPQSPIATLKTSKKKKASKSGRQTGSVNFPIDFFENCQQSNDIEYGGNDILQIYNTQQVKHRLNTTGMYIASTKPAGFSMEITNTNNTTVMVGLRVFVGSQAVERAPTYLETFGRTVQVTCLRPRWVDVPFTKEESLNADKKFTLFVGPSTDAGGVTMVDSIKVFTKTKEVFGWPEEPDEFSEQAAPKIAPAAPSAPNAPETENKGVTAVYQPLTSADKLLSSALEVLDGAFAVMPMDEKHPLREKALATATDLLTLPTPAPVQQHTRALLASLFTNRTVYFAHKDETELLSVIKSLTGEGDAPVMDVEAFQRLLVTSRSVAVSRPTNLVKFAEQATHRNRDTQKQDEKEVLEVVDLERPEPTPAIVGHLEGSERCHFVSQMMQAFWRLLAARPANPMLAPVCLPGLAHVEATVCAIVEIIHAFTVSDLDHVTLASKLYARLLLDRDSSVSFACKQALIRALRPRARRKRVFIPSPPRCHSPEEEREVKDSNPETTAVQSLAICEAPDNNEEEDMDMEIVESSDPLVMEPSNGEDSHPLQALLQRAAGSFNPVVDIPPDADDETMVELAIALSLQEQNGGGLNLQGLRLASQQQNRGQYDEGQMSDTTASAPGSDDEMGSNAATDGSTLRTSPAEHAGSAGSESGNSAEGSISGDQNASGRSSVYGDRERGPRSETSSLGVPSASLPQDAVDTESDRDSASKLHSLRLALLERLLQYLPDVSKRGGVNAIPFMQVILMLTSDLDCDDDKDCAALNSLLSVLLTELNLSGSSLEAVDNRTDAFEVKLVYLRLLSVLLSRTKSGTKPSTESSSFISNISATMLVSSGAIPYCLTILRNLLPYWRNFNPAEEESAPLPGQLLRPRPTSPPPDMSPFFLRQYVRGHANDVFEDYPQLLTEMALRLPYQLKKIGDCVSSVSRTDFDTAWHTVLAEYLMTQRTPFVKKQVRKLLLFICGTKEKYRELRDLHSIEMNLQSVTSQCQKSGLSAGDVAPHSVLLPYDSLLVLIEHLKVCSDIASSRPINWQKYCLEHPEVLLFLVRSSISLDEGVAPTLLQLLQCALCGAPGVRANSAPQEGPTASSNKQAKVKDPGHDADTETAIQKPEESLCMSLIKLLSSQISDGLMMHFVRTFLLESNSTSIRWQAHALVHQIYKNSSDDQQASLLDLLWTLWKELPMYGRKAAQFVDLLGYFVLITPQNSEKKTKEYLDQAIDLLKDENQRLANHPNSQIYNMLQGLVDFDGYYLESDPCLVCNNPEVQLKSEKLTNMKVDSKFTTTTQIVKLVGSYTISKIILRITELKRTKMVRVMNIYYNNRTVQAVVELKNKPSLWHKARKMTLSPGQTDVKIEFPIPIVACNLMIEYADFHDNLQATSETLQCPRCSASVPANPGVCGNCGENVFQCHKCRAINYDEKDPFLCNACGFCKYAKFDFTLTARPCCAVDPIETEDDRKKAITTINTLLEKADRIYKQLQQHRPQLEELMVKVAEHGAERREEGAALAATAGSGGAPQGPAVNRAIQHLALKYCSDSKTSFDELSKIIQKVLACRKELVDYDRQQRQAVAVSSSPVTSPRESESIKPPVRRVNQSSGQLSNCFGCASATVEHCITLLRALVTNTNLRQILCSQGMIQELIDYNLRRGTLPVRSEVRSLLCLLTRDNRRGTEEMNNIIMTRIAASVRGHLSNPDLGSSVRHEILLLSNSLRQEDSCWESRVRCVMRLFLMGMQMKQPVVMESVTLPCLRILKDLITPEKLQPAKTGEAKPGETTPTMSLPAELHVNSQEWLQGNPKYLYANWRKCVPSQTVTQKVQTPPEAKPEGQKEENIEKAEEEPNQSDERARQRVKFLAEKYATRWRHRMWKVPGVPLKLTQTTWLQAAMFSPSSQSARQTATRVIEYMAQVPLRRKEIIDMLSGCLEQVGRAGECAQEFLALFSRLIQPVHWKYYLAVKGMLLKLGDLITREVEKLQYLEETTLSSDLALGFALKSLTELLSLFVQQKLIKQHYKNRLVGYVLNGYLSLKKLLVQRTKLIDETQDKLLELLEELTSGTESETREFMQVCVDTVKKYPLDDQVSPVFIFERLCSIIFPEENDVGDFFMILEKDPQQEDFLQGRMLGNPYSSSEAGLGPLMRDVKNKICQDCELVALLEDDTGMELLVNKKIISLDLPVKDVYKKIWAPDHGEGEPMQVIYRMRGLLGDATEDMVNSLDNNTQEDVDKEEVYRMANVLAQGGGLRVMLDRLGSVKDLVLGKPLMLVLLKLFSFTVNVKVNRQELIKPELNTITVMLGALNLALWAEQESGTTATKGQTITEQILQIMETILLEASSQSTDKYTEFSKLCGDQAQLMMLLERINSPFVRSNTSVLQALMRLIPFLAFGEEDKMLTLINHFKPYLDFSKFDEEHTQDEKVHLDCFCTIAAAIQNNANGVRLKDMIVEQGLVQMSLDYIMKNAPEIKTLLATDSELWKDFLSKPSLNYVLRFLTGICDGHENTQLLLGNHLIPILHKLEQVSSDKHIGTLAENFMETLKKSSVVAGKIEEVRQQTKTEKKRLAMAVRKKQLGALGMTTNSKGQVTVKSSVLKQMEEIKEETGLTCCICREGYRYQPQKVLAIYTFTKRCVLDEFENKQRKTIGYTTVSHFNVIHVDCHTAAVRHARGREEWESAALQNANTKCNGLLPLWGPQVQESAFATCLARHNTYLQECTGVRDPNYQFSVHDVKLLLQKFAEEKSFSDDSGGGGRQSNMHLLPFMMHMSLYVINTTRSNSREDKNLNNFLEAPRDKWIDSCFEAESAPYWCVMASHLLSPDQWKTKRVQLLERLLVTAHIRNVGSPGSKTVSDKTVKEYAVYKPYLVLFGLVDGMYRYIFKNVTIQEDDWPRSLADYVRNSDKAVLESCDRLLAAYQDEMLPCESLAEFADVLELLEDIPDPDKFLNDAVQSLP